MYNPGNWGVLSQGLANFSAGAAGGAEGVAEGLQRMQQKRDLAKSLRSLFGAVDPDHKDMYEAMGLPELQGKLQSYSVQHTVNLLQQQRQQMQQEESIGEALNRYSSGPPAMAESEGSIPGMESVQGETGVPGLESLKSYAPGNEDRIRYALATPGLGGTGAVKLLGALQNYHTMRQQNLLPAGSAIPVGDIGYVVGTGTNNHFAANPRSAAGRDSFFTREDLAIAAEIPGAPGWRRITTGPNASQLVYTMGAAPEVSAMTDSEGNPTGQLGYFDGKRWVRFEDPSYSGPAVTLVDDKGNVIPGQLYLPKSKKVIDTRSQLEKAFGSTPTKKPEEKKDDRDPLGIRKFLK